MHPLPRKRIQPLKSAGASRIQELPIWSLDVCQDVRQMEVGTYVHVTLQENKARSDFAEKLGDEGNEDYIIITVRVGFHKIISS